MDDVISTLVSQDNLDSIPLSTDESKTQIDVVPCYSDAEDELAVFAIADTIAGRPHNRRKVRRAAVPTWPAGKVVRFKVFDSVEIKQLLSGNRNDE